MRRENRWLVTFGILLIVTILIIAGSQSGVLRIIQTAIMAPLKPAAGLLTDGAGAAQELTEDPLEYADLEERALELERLVAEMQVEIVRLREIEQDYYRLSDILNYASENTDQNFVTADVIARDTSSYLRWVIINRGTRDGVQVGNPAISDLGLVGRVESVAANAAWIRLTNDPESAINARLQTARAEGTVTGQLQGGLRMELIPQEALVEPGDLVLTSGLGGTFPANIVIGQVTSVRRQQADLFQSAEIRPTVDYDNLRIVSIITSFEPVDLATFDEVIESEGGTGQ
ncbi:MAG: rod shape-determining protein MreC [Anaerolineae bacterium]|nr:rod shape-determining protein MreC [Anaerolineae bacterium]